MVRRLLVPAIVAALLVAGGMPTADAKTRTFRDKMRDAPSAIDIRRAHLTNGPRMLKTTIKVRNLRRAGRFSLIVSPTSDGDEWYSANVRHRRGGGVKARLMHVQVVSQEPVKRCKVRARWNKRQDRIRIAFPHRCIRWHRRAYRMSARSHWFAKNKSDETKHRAVRRG